MDLSPSGSAGAAPRFSIDFQRLFESCPHPYLVLHANPAFTIAAASERYLTVTGAARETIVGLPLFDAFPPNPGTAPTGADNLRSSLERVLRDRVQHVMSVQRYDLPRAGGYELKYWSPVNTPVFDSSGEIPWIIHHVEDVTEFVQMRARHTQHEPDRRSQQPDRMQAEVLLRASEVARANEELQATQRMLELRERELARANESLAYLNQSLEQRVRERTLELMATNERLGREMKEKVTLLSEIHHRVKNNLQIISSLLDLQSMQLEDPAIRTMLQNSMLRIQSMALIHQTLYQSKDFARVAFDEVLNTLACNISSSCGIDESRIQLAVRTEPLKLSISAAIPCGLIVNELITNALKHAFPTGRGGTITVKLRETGGRAELSVSDDGIGLPAGKSDASRTLGLELITILTDQLGGTLAIERANPTCFRISFPLQ